MLLHAETRHIIIHVCHIIIHRCHIIIHICHICCCTPKHTGRLETDSEVPCGEGKEEESKFTCVN